MYEDQNYKFVINALLEDVRYFRSVVLDVGSHGTTAHAHKCYAHKSYARLYRRE